MAKQVTGDTPRGRGAPTQYQWDRWSNGRAWNLTPGEDYTVSESAVRSAAHAWAKNHGFTVETWLEDGGITVKFTKIEDKK